MIRLTRLNHALVYLNPELMEHIETTPDTVITMTNGQKMVVCEKAEQVVERIMEYRRAIVSGKATESQTIQNPE